ncbi:unnamed protein product [Menidia menidia]|uniref:(Atlantic silverside) hypothetical protein n=1 Tax=Menidia menidia TaxID=238744 RepID=A0A8S4B3Z0_9TELE|nr:unnamed protein product [Menidia menidia]
MAKSEKQRRSLKSEEFFFDSDASLLDQQDLGMSGCPFDDVFNSKDSHMEQINTFLKNVQVLLEAARFLESSDRKDGKCTARKPAFLLYEPASQLSCLVNKQERRGNGQEEAVLHHFDESFLAIKAEKSDIDGGQPQENMTAVQLINIQRLLEAAEYLERRERECEHGYASTFPSNQSTNYQRQRKFRNKKFSSNHNRDVITMPPPRPDAFQFVTGLVLFPLDSRSPRKPTKAAFGGA